MIVLGFSTTTTTSTIRIRTSLHFHKKNHKPTLVVVSTHVPPASSKRQVRTGTHLDALPDDDSNNGQAAEQLGFVLAKLDRQWRSKNSQRVSNRPTGGIAGWTKLILIPDASNTASTSTSTRTSSTTGSPFSSYTATEDTTNIPVASWPFNENVEQQQQQQRKEEFVYLLEPPSTPSMILLFLGGAGLGQYPHIAYSEFLCRISKRLNAAIIAAPYPLSLDHFDLSKKTGELLRRAVAQCEDEGGYSKTLPKFYLGHSLGSKLLGIVLAASGGGMTDVDGIGFMSYNNFGFRDTLSMVQDFARDLNLGGGGGMGAGVGAGVGGKNGMNTPWNLDSILNLAGEAMSMMGIDFNPDPLTMNRIIEMKYNQELQKKTKLFIFDKDDLDSSPSFLEACQKHNTGSASIGPSISRLKGNHLSPVYLKVSMDDLYSLDFPQEAMPFVTEASRGFQSASFGEEEFMNGAVNEICAWIMGKDKNINKDHDTSSSSSSSGGPNRLSAGTSTNP